MKKILMINITLLLVIGLSTGCGSKKTNDTKEDKIEEKQLGVIDISNVSIEIKNGKTVITTLLENNSKYDSELKQYNILLKDENGKVVNKIQKTYGNTIKSGDNIIVTDEVVVASKIVSVEYEKK